jgi:hypothetical protein
MLIRQIAMCFCKRHDARAQLLKPEPRKMTSKSLAHYIASAAAGASADFVQHALQVLVEPESHDIPLHISQCNTGQVAFFQSPRRIAIERRESGSCRGSADSSGSEGFQAETIRRAVTGG